MNSASTKTPSVRAGWIGFLDAQIAALDVKIQERHGPALTRAEMTTFMNSQTVAGRVWIEDVLEEFSGAADWPARLSVEQLVNVQFRAFVARRFLATDWLRASAMLKLLSFAAGLRSYAAGRVNADKMSIAVADPADNEKFTRWLLVDLFEIIARQGLMDQAKAMFVSEKARPEACRDGKTSRLQCAKKAFRQLGYRIWGRPI